MTRKRTVSEDWVGSAFLVISPPVEDTRMCVKTPLLVTCLLLWAAACSPTAADELGEVPAGGFRSPEGDRRFSPETGVKPLNNLVFELLNIRSPGSSTHKFRNFREGWVYTRVSTNADDRPVVVLDDKPLTLKMVDGHFEAMRYITAGEHSVAISRRGGPVNRLEVRAIGELFHATYGANPHVPEIGVYTWDFLRRHCLDHYNSIIGSNSLSPAGKVTQEAEIKQWTAAGKRWFTLHPLPWKIETADEAFDYWTQTLGMQHPLMSGIWADEFGVGERHGKKTADMYPLWTAAIRRIHVDSKYKNRKFYAYCPVRLLPVERCKEMFPFIQTVMDCGYRLGPEWYLPEGRSRPGRIINKTDDLLAEFSPGWEGTNRESFERASTGAATNRVVVVSLLSEPGWETGDLYPNYDFNVFLDAQLQFIATDPAFFGTRGLQGYQSSYCGEEQLRLFARLVRHYAIEGNTRRLLKDPYVLAHIQNSDFSDGTKGWTVAPAVATAKAQSIAVKTVTGFGRLQGKYHAPKGTGDVALWTRRSGKRPNVISQQVRNLTPGRLYSLRLITGDYQELRRGKSLRRSHTVSANIEGVELLSDKCFQAVISGGYWYPHGDFKHNNPYWINYHQQVFRAQERTARLVLSDWVSPQAAGGLTGAEMLWNFIQVQPYYE